MFRQTAAAKSKSVKRKLKREDIIRDENIKRIIKGPPTSTPSFTIPPENLAVAIQQHIVDHSSSETDEIVQPNALQCNNDAVELPKSAECAHSGSDVGEFSDSEIENYLLSSASESHFRSENEDSEVEIELRKENLDKSRRIKEKLIKWSQNFHIRNNALSYLLQILKEETDFNLPGDSRTLLRTARKSKVVSRTDGSQTSSFGLAKVLQKIQSKLIVIEKENKELRKEVKTLREKVELKLNHTESPEVTTAIGKIVKHWNWDTSEYRNLPLANQSELQVLEREVTKSSSKATSLAQFLCRGSGFKDAKTLTLLIMKRLLSRDLAMLYSLEGRQKKLRFNELNLFLVVIASVKMQFPEADDKEIRSRVGTVLARSGDWDGYRVRKKSRAFKDEDNSTKSED